MWKLKRFATYSFVLEHSTRTTNDKNGLFKKLPTRIEDSWSTMLWCLSQIIIALPYLISPGICALLADAGWVLGKFLTCLWICILSTGSILLPRKPALGSYEWLQLQLEYWVKGVIPWHQLSCFTCIGQTVQIKPIRSSSDV